MDELRTITDAEESLLIEWKTSSMNLFDRTSLL